jgi:capsular exopolysaccharide synthesis family protein
MNNVSIVDYPVEPRSPVKPNLPINAAGGLAIGLLLGAAAALGRGMLDRTVKTPGDLEQLGIPTFLGLIPEIAENAARPGPRRRAPTTGQPELIVHNDPMSGVAEASRSIRTNLLFMAPDKPYRTLLVTSAGPAEGKTTIACCVATAIAQAGKRVCLVDCDLRRPRLHRIFRTNGRDLGPGLATALVDDTVKDCAVETEVPNLSVIPAGPIPPNPSELLHSERFKTFLARLSERFDQVILDSPPVAAVTDATILSTLVDGTLLVVRANRTAKEVARHANRVLQNVGANFAGCVLNAVNLNRDEYKYSYYYYRREGYYANSTGRPSRNGAEPPEPPSAHA